MGLDRKKAVGMDALVKAYIKTMGLAPGLNTRRVFAAWDACSGAAPFTLRRYFRSGTLYVTLASSVVRNQLYFQRELLVDKMNAYLLGDDLFTEDNRSVGIVKNLVLK